MLGACMFFQCIYSKVRIWNQSSPWNNFLVAYGTDDVRVHYPAASEVLCSPGVSKLTQVGGFEGPDAERRGVWARIDILHHARNDVWYGSTSHVFLVGTIEDAWSATLTITALSLSRSCCVMMIRGQLLQLHREGHRGVLEDLRFHEEDIAEGGVRGCLTWVAAMY